MCAPKDHSFGSFIDMLSTGRFFIGPMTASTQRDALSDKSNDRAKVCLSCGARQSLDGTLPCGH